MEESIVKKMVTLQSSDGEKFEIEEEVAMQSKIIKDMIEDGCDVEAILIPQVTSTVLAKVIEYCKKHAKVDNIEELKAWDAEFMNVDNRMLFALMNAANFANLGIKSLLDLTCQTVNDIVRRNHPEDEVEVKVEDEDEDEDNEDEEELPRDNYQTCCFSVVIFGVLFSLFALWYFLI